MPIRELIEQIAVGWFNYQHKGRVEKKDAEYGLVVQQLPEALKVHLASYETIVAEGSTGAGNITAAPWIALFDRRLTTSATKEYYVVYLFATATPRLTSGRQKNNRG